MGQFWHKISAAFAATLISDFFIFISTHIKIKNEGEICPTQAQVFPCKLNTIQTSSN